MNTQTAVIVAAAVGAGVGATFSFLAVLLQIWAQNRREKLSLAIQAAVEVQKLLVDECKAWAKKGHPTALVPISLTLYYQHKIVDLVSKGKLTKKSLQEFHEKYAVLEKYIFDYSSEKEKKS